MTNAVSWRKEGIKYNINEAWLDFIEKVDELISSNGNVLSSQINSLMEKCSISAKIYYNKNHEQ